MRHAANWPWITALLLVGGMTPACEPASAPSIPPGPTAPSEPALQIELPHALGARRTEYARDVERARARVVAWFDGQGLAVDGDALVDRVVVFPDVAEAKRRLAEHYGIPEDQIPDSFSGTVDGATLFVVSRETYAATYARLYPEQSFSADAYAGLITHELAHRAHALFSQGRFGSEDGMGPTWFFEGLAIVCAGQFDGAPLLTWPDAHELILRDATAPLGYPRYGQLLRSLAARIPIRWMMERAGEADFVAALQRAYLDEPS